MIAEQAEVEPAPRAGRASAGRRRGQGGGDGGAIADPWTARARPTFLYIIYALLLWSVPIGLLGAVDPASAQAVIDAMRRYWNAIPEPLYALFGTGYLGYTAARAWGKAKGVDR